MSGSTLAMIAAQAVAMALLGFAGGVAYFAGLRRTVAAVAARRAWWRPVLMTLGRLALAALALGLAAKLGPVALLAAFAGFLVARARAIRAARGAA